MTNVLPPLEQIDLLPMKKTADMLARQIEKQLLRSIYGSFGNKPKNMVVTLTELPLGWRVTFGYERLVPISMLTKKLETEVLPWVRENCHGTYMTGSADITFRQHEDALMCYLRFK